MTEYDDLSEKILKNCLYKSIEDIYVTGYSEVRSGYHYFSPMPWWFYIKIEDFYLRVASNQFNGTLYLDLQVDIQCNFDLEEKEIFTVSSANKTDYAGQVITNYDLFLGSEDSWIYGLGIQFRDDKYLPPYNQYIFFSCLSFDEIIFGGQNLRDEFLNDSRFRSVTMG